MLFADVNKGPLLKVSDSWTARKTWSVKSNRSVGVVERNLRSVLKRSVFTVRPTRTI